MLPNLKDKHEINEKFGYKLQMKTELLNHYAKQYSKRNAHA